MILIIHVLSITLSLVNGMNKKNTFDNDFGAADMDFKVGGPWSTGKYCRLPWLADKKNFRILEALEWLKQ